ncbi:insulin gene enhancer protein isl-2b-like isoform X2 [Hemibagrus wyckioides]|uniref:insulin gene enhancer protein isl-2b-like isoform X2 n=1 Tax=Hemibagrus wyckioides TaxID=337641 RepID=UPI00266D65E9|nr:insulin gene enhancer protein isl-2b-like isoform X2 [Hemibagrus wyckioides]
MEEPEKEEKGFPSFCVGCGLVIRDRFVLSVFPDLLWHVACLKCAECQQNLEESHTCFIKDGKTLCKDDYSRLYASKCAKCLKSFSSHDYVMRAGVNVYHVQCFRCERCDRQLQPGDEFTIRDGFLYCTGHENSSHGLITLTRNSVHVTELDRCDEGADTSWSGGEGDAGWLAAPMKPEKTVRVRTALSKSQLHVLLTCYSVNPRPDASLKERLMEMTGLSSRVIRIWFQNKRCKDKKKGMLERETKHESGEQIDTMDEPVSTVTAENLDIDTLMHPLDLQTLQQSWKLLTSLLSSDIDETLYQEAVTLDQP